MYDVRCTMYDVRFENSRALRGERRRLAAPMLAKPWTQLCMIRAPFEPTTLYDFPHHLRLRFASSRAGGSPNF